MNETEEAEFEEFLRARREAEAELTLKKLTIDATARETDRHVLNAACDLAKRLGVNAVAVSPVNVSAARRRLGECESAVACVVGGTGESQIPIKQKEAKRAMKQGASIIRLTPCYSALFGNNTSHLKREIKKVRRAAKKCRIVLSLDDHALGKEEIERGLHAAAEGKADAISVRGETGLALLAARLSAGRLSVEASGVENAEQMRLLLRAGVERIMTKNAEKISEELYTLLARRSGNVREERADKKNAKKNETAQ